MPLMGIARTTEVDLLPAHPNQLPEHPSLAAYEAPIYGSQMSTTTIGQAVGAIASASMAISPSAAPKPARAPSPEVVCPLLNADNSSCRKKCSGTFAYRSICEHIRRAHPDHWIPRLPASAESFRKMISTPPVPKNMAQYSTSASIGSGASGTVTTGTGSAPINTPIRRTGTGSISKARAKALKTKLSLQEEQFIEGYATGIPPESDNLRMRSMSMNGEPREIYDYETASSEVVSEADTESDPTRSPLSPTLGPQNTSRPSTASKGASSKAKVTTSRKKSVVSNGSKTSSSPRKVPVRRRVEKKGSGSNTSSFYSTPCASSQDLASMSSSVVDLMDVDCDLTPRQNFLMNGYPGRARHEEELDEDEVGLILGGMSRSHHDISKSDTGANQLRRAYSFSAGDGLTGNVSKSVKPRSNLAVQTNIANQRYPGEKFPSGSLSAGGFAGKEWNNQDSGSAWDELIEAALAAREENHGDSESGRKSPLPYQSIHPTHRETPSPYGPDLPPSLMMMMDIASAEADILQREKAQIRQRQQSYQSQPARMNQQSHPMYSNNNNQQWYNPPISYYSNGPSHNVYSSAPPPFGNGNSYQMSPMLHGGAYRSGSTSTNPTSTASSPPFSKPSSPRVSSAQRPPRIQCSMCRIEVDLSNSLACTECIHGFCRGCVAANIEPSDRDRELEKDMEGIVAGVGGINRMSLGSPALDAQRGESSEKFQSISRPSESSRPKAARCGVCGVSKPKYKPVNLILV